MNLPRNTRQDDQDRACGVEVVYISALRFGKKVRCRWWYGPNHTDNKFVQLPGKNQTTNCGLVYVLKEVLKTHRKKYEAQYACDRPPILVVKTNATYISDALDTYIFSWRNNNWCNKKCKKIANYVFWMGVDNEFSKLYNLGIDIKIEHGKFHSF